jgi:integrase
MKLTEYVSRYELRHDIRPSTAAQLRVVARLFTAWAGADDLSALADDAVNAWLLRRKNDGRSPRTVKGNRISLLMLWRSAAREGLVGQPQFIRVVKCPESVIEGYDARQMRALIDAADRMRGNFVGTRIDKRRWWRSLLLSYWDTSLRLGDLFSIERAWIVPQPRGVGSLSIVQQKTGGVTRHFLRKRTMAAIDTCMKSPNDGRRLIWSMPFGRRAFYRAFKRLAESAGLGGTSKYIRRGSSSEVERIAPGMGSIHLGHKSPDLFRKSYRVARIVQPEVILPPPIG